MTRAETLENARKAVCGERENEYGTPEDNFNKIAGLWTAYLGYEVLLDAVDVAMMMSLLKIARVKSGHGSDDSFVDLAGYAACGAEIHGRVNEMTPVHPEEVETLGIEDMLESISEAITKVSKFFANIHDNMEEENADEN